MTDRLRVFQLLPSLNLLPRAAEERSTGGVGGTHGCSNKAHTGLRGATQPNSRSDPTAMLRHGNFSHPLVDSDAFGRWFEAVCLLAGLCVHG